MSRRRRYDDDYDYDDPPPHRNRSAFGAGLGGTFGVLAALGLIAVVVVGFFVVACAGGLHMAEEGRQMREQHRVPEGEPAPAEPAVPTP